MDRKALAAYVGILLPLGTMFTVGCGSRAANSHSQRPAILHELQASAPGPWRRLDAPTTASSSVAVVPASEAPPTAESEIVPVADAPAPPVAEAESDLPELSAPPLAGEDDLPVPSETSVPSATASPAIEPTLTAPSESAPVGELGPVASTDSTLGEITKAETVAAELPPAGTRLPWASVTERTPEMAAVAQRAEHRVRHSFQLAERGATYSARAEFIAALQLIAQANDTQQGTRLYTRALAAGLTALRESSDFVRPNAERGEIDVVRIVARHKTPILKSEALEQLAPTVAAQRYYTYAQEQLAAAAAREMSGSMALYGLGKLAAAASGDKVQPMERAAHAMAFFQAALMAEPRNYRAANELGVLLAQHGHLARARDLLAQSISISPHVAAWHNLAVVHAQLGERQLADRAARQARAMQQAGLTDPPIAVQLLEPGAFVRTMPAADSLPPAATNQSAPAASANDKQPAGNIAKRPASDLLPWNSRR